jgi:hypothetical protein
MFKNFKDIEEDLFGNQLTNDIINVNIVNIFYSVIHARWANICLYAYPSVLWYANILSKQSHTAL